MYDFEAEISEMSRFLKRTNKYVFIFNWVETFLILYAISILFDLSGVFSLIIGFDLLKVTVMGYTIPVNAFIIYTVGLVILSFISSIIRRKKARQSYIFSQLEKTYPDVEEKLAAAYDNKAVDNIFMQNLDTEIVEDMEDVGLSSFVNSSRITRSIIVSVIAFSLILSLGFTGIGFDVPKNATLESLAGDISQSPAFSTLEALAGGSGEGSDGQGEGDSSTEAAESDITGSGGGGAGDGQGGPSSPYGEISIAAEGTDDLDFTIYGGGIGTETPLRDASEIATSQTDVPPNFVPQQVTSQTYSYDTPVEYKSKIQEYFKELSK